MRITFVARLFGELVTTVLPERVPGVIEKLWDNANVEVYSISIIGKGSDAEVAE